MKRLAAAGAVGVVIAGCAVLGMADGEAAPADTCVFFRVSAAGQGFSTLSRVSLPDATTAHIADLRYRVNAIAYAVDTNSLWGLSTRSTDGYFGDGAHVVAIGSDGDIIDHGPVRRGPDLPYPVDHFSGSTAGTIVGDTLLVRDDSDLYRISLDAGSPNYLSVVDVLSTYPDGQIVGVDDLDVHGNAAYGVYADSWASRVVRIDLSTGEVTRVDAPVLPGTSSYGFSVLSQDGSTLYAAANRIGDRSRLYRVGLSRNGTVDEIGTWPATSTSDATSCLPGVEPATTPQQTPEQPPVPPAPTPTRAPAIRTTTPVTISPTPIPVVPPPPPEPVPTTAVPSPPAQVPIPTPAAPSSRRYRPLPTTAAAGVAPRSHAKTQEKRRWSLTMLIIIVGAGAAGAATRRRR
ncbi:DUF6923 family protein [Actinokineospora inagensis]|uniref:DUF6923 family protein n=1 Tax=Actinokineospora inagensis TaxID=103730 RepID=UPI0004236B8C|nr:hypothetical protein [Actinokineospora inagensis]